MKHAVIVAHPRVTSFTRSLARGYVDAVHAMGHRTEVRDLYVLNFDPRLRADEIPDAAGFAPGDDVKAERALLADADVFAFFYPFWFNAPPAMLKGYLERVFGMGFSYSRISGGTKPLFAGRKMFSVSTSGAPQDSVRQTGAPDAERKLFDIILPRCGHDVVDHAFRWYRSGIRSDFAERCVDDVSCGPPSLRWRGINEVQNTYPSCHLTAAVLPAARLRSR
jgi:NAD(P)H dehydrogenase (quinone)